MNFEQLKSFICVAKMKSFSEAAKERYVSQPTISNQLKALEKELDVRLLDRNSQNISLTENGKKFEIYAKQILDLENQARQCFGTADVEKKKIVDIVAPGLQVDHQLADFFVRAEYEVRDRDFIYRIVAKESEEIPQMIIDGKADFGITSEWKETPELEYDYAFTEEIVLITPNTSQYRNLNMNDFRDILQNDAYVRFDFGEGSDYLWNDFFGRTLEVWLHDIHTVARCSNYRLVIKAVEENMGIAFISSVIIEEAVRQKRVLAYRCKDLLQKRFYLVSKKNKLEKSNAMLQTKELLLDVIKESIPEIYSPC